MPESQILETDLRAQTAETQAKALPAENERRRNVESLSEIGKGIPKDAREKIFNPFFTTKPAGQGTGLGLLISHEIVVQQHRGEVKVETEEGRFTEFVVRLLKMDNAFVNNNAVGVAC